MTKYYKKRGYVKWTDENGVKHKVRESEFKEPNDGEAEEDVESTDGVVSDIDATLEGNGLV